MLHPTPERSEPELTRFQAKLLAEWVDDREPSGVYCKGPALRAAEKLAELGLAQRAREGRWVGAYYKPTEAGKAYVYARREAPKP